MLSVLHTTSELATTMGYVPLSYTLNIRLALEENKLTPHETN